MLYHVIKSTSFLILLLCIYFLTTAQALATIPRVELDWYLPNIYTISNYKLYYSYDKNMSSKIWHSKCTTSKNEEPGFFSTVCTNVPINTFPAYIQITVQLANGLVLFSNIQEMTKEIKINTMSVPLQ